MATRNARRLALFLLFVVVVPVAATHAQQAGPDSAFTFAETMVPMRDGVRLHTVYFVPKNQAGPLPILFVRTPYGIPGRDFPLSRAY